MRPLPFSASLGVAALAALWPGQPVRAAETSAPPGWFVWPVVEPAAGTAPDVSWLNTAPAGGRGRVGVQDGHFATADGQRIRFLGTNITAEDCFRSAAAAEAFARLLAKGGVNIARLHHLDNAWGGGTGSLWPAGGPKHRELDPAQLDKLHRLMAALKANGIYSNLNLKVSKTLTEADGFPASIAQLPDFQKRVDFFDPRMIELQKDYARRLLTTKNPYTGLTPVEDPAVAIVEINNENSLMGYFTRDLGRGLDRLPEEFRGELAARWNAWLGRRYASDAALTAAWFTTPDGAAKVLVESVAALRLEAREGARLEKRPVATDPAAVELRVVSGKGVEWHAQAAVFGLPLQDGLAYTVEFDARADHPRPLQLGVGLDSRRTPAEPWRSLGLMESMPLGVEWQRVRRVFIAHSVGNDAGRLSLGLGQAGGTVWVRGLRLRAGIDRTSLPAGEAVRTGTVGLPAEPSARQWADWIAFLAETERGYAEEMRRFLREELGVRALIICSQQGFGGITALNREVTMDFADAHAYWQHPEFGDAGWNPIHWTVRNSPQLAELGPRQFGELGNLAMLRVAGKPFTVSEYDHPAAGDFVCEMYPTMATFAGRQDWDGLYPFCAGRYGPDDDGTISGFFDQQHHPAKWSQAPFAAVVFREGLVAPAAVAIELRLGAPVWGEASHSDLLWKKLVPAGSFEFLDTRMGVGDRPLAGTEPARLDRTGSPDTPCVSLFAAPHGRVWRVAGDRAAAAVGFLGGAEVEAGVLKVKCGRFGRDFAAVTAVALDRRPLRESERVLVTIVGRAENQGMGWNAARTSVGDRWGHGPTIVERVPAEVSLALTSGHSVYSLAPDGTRVRKIAAAEKDGRLMFAVGEADRTVHYEIVGGK